MDKLHDGYEALGFSRGTGGDLFPKGIVSALVGTFLGIFCSIVVNCTLVEISVSSFFSFYFGILFLGVGSLIYWRVNGPNSDRTEAPKKREITYFSFMIMLSGILCFLLNQGWFMVMPGIAKVPFFVLLGVSVSFALIFSIVDLVNYLMGLFQLNIAKSLIHSTNQVTLITIIAILMGATFGLIFGIMDVEDQQGYNIRLALLREQKYCYPIGAFFGALAGFGNEAIRHNETKLQQRVIQFDYDI